MRKKNIRLVFFSFTSIIFLNFSMLAIAEKEDGESAPVKSPQENTQIQDRKQVGAEKTKKSSPSQKGLDVKNLGKMLADMCVGIVDSAEMQVSNTKNGVDISISSKDPTQTALAQNCAKMLQMVFVTYKSNRKK
ncbi:MAG: hypothetical protein KBD78_02935 [Oligoflexales bacterium]|nr:hypothetical protein [Oligoflexales bacterium]